MSAPDTNINKQEKRHRPSLWSVKGAMLIVVLIFLGIVGFSLITSTGDDDATDSDATGPTTTAPATDTYEPGTNSSATPTATD
ncbi:hypothetical protein OS189_08070 [Sulfitobacter sp. F26169L]|uniref:hypothetical protein n=1 Tax=Sulfitobacter sp. F26169L TaxID=2996015 RepID=UPI002260D75E|nr:hypothetical protein [Sulfitobacter sp. F26169L]MCX7566297.1 hypothetical protein [Sulfitobacter sp. F26169L]